MHRRAALATAGAITATLITGVAAIGATTGLLDSIPSGSRVGHAQLVDRTAPNPSTPRVMTVYVDDPPAAAPTASAPPATAGAPNPPAAPRTAASRSTAAASPTPAPSPGAHEDDDRDLPTTAPPVVTNPSPSVDCHGSDDGMTEAEKQAREAACHDHEDDD